jgi:hypothetical protein
MVFLSKCFLANLAIRTVRGRQRANGVGRHVIDGEEVVAGGQRLAEGNHIIELAADFECAAEDGVGRNCRYPKPTVHHPWEHLSHSQLLPAEVCLHRWNQTATHQRNGRSFGWGTAFWMLVGTDGNFMIRYLLRLWVESEMYTGWMTSLPYMT